MASLASSLVTVSEKTAGSCSPAGLGQRRLIRWLIGFGLVVGLSLAGAACIPKPPPPMPSDDGAFDPDIDGSDIFIGSGLSVPTDNAFGRSFARLAAAQVGASDEFLGLVLDGGGSGDPGDPGTAAAPVGGDPLGSSLTVFDRCANDDCSLRSSLVLDDPDVAVEPGVSTTYSGTGTLTIAGDGGIVRTTSSSAVQGTVVVDAASGDATISFSTPVWQDAAGVVGVRLDDVVVSGVLAGGPGGSGDVLVDGTGVVTGANSWGLADGVAARVSATIGSARPVVAAGGFDTSEGGSVERLIGTAPDIPEAVRRWFRAPEFWVISAPDGGESRLGPKSPGTEVRLGYEAAIPDLTLTSQSWTFGSDTFEAVMGIAGSSIPGGRFTGTAWLNVRMSPASVIWNASGPVRMNVSPRQPAVAGDIVADVNWDEPNECTPCSTVRLGMDTVWIGPVRAAGVDSYVSILDGAGSYEIEAVGGVNGGFFGPISVTSGSLYGWADSGAGAADLGVGGKTTGHNVTATTAIDLTSPTATVSTDVAVDDQMSLRGDLDADLAAVSWAATYPATFTMDGVDYGVPATAMLARNGFDVQVQIEDPVTVVSDGITFVSSTVRALGTAVSISGDAEWTGTGVSAPATGTLDGTPDGIAFDLSSDAVFTWANGQVELRDLEPRGVMQRDSSVELSGTLEIPGNVMTFEGTAVASPSGWQLDLYEAPGSPNPFTLELSWDFATGELSGTGTSASLNFGRVAVTDSPFTLFANVDTVEVSPSAGGRVRVDGGDTLDAPVVGAVVFDDETGMLSAEVAGDGTVLGRDGLDVSGTVDASIVGSSAEWVDLDLVTSGEVAVGGRDEVRLDTIGVSGRLEGDMSTLTMDAGVNLMGVALAPVAGDVAVTVTPENRLDSVGLDLSVPGAPGQGVLDLDFAGGLASLAVSGNVGVDVLDYGDFSIEGLVVTVGFVPPSSVSVTATFEHIRYRDQVDLAGTMGVTFNLFAPGRLVMAAQASGQIGALQVTDLAVDMVWDIPTQTFTGTSSVGSIADDYGRVKIVGGGISFFGDADSFDVSSSSASRVLVDDGATLDAEVSGAVSWDEPTGMLHVTVTGVGTVLGKAQLSVTGTVDAHIVGGQAEWVDLGLDASGDVRFGDRAEVRITSFVLTGRLEGRTASLTMEADLNVLGRDVSVAGTAVATLTDTGDALESLVLDLAASPGGGIQAGLHVEIAGDLSSYDLQGWLTADRLEYGDLVIEDLRLDLSFDGTAVQLSAQATHVRYQDTVDVGGQITLGWDVGSEILSISGDIDGRVGVIRGGVQFAAVLNIPARHLSLNATASGRAVFGEGRQSAWFEDFHVWGEIDLDADLRATADLNVDGTVGFASEDIGAPIEVSMVGTLAATFDGANLDLTLSVALSGTISAANVTLGVSADLTAFPLEPVITLQTEELAFTIETYEFSGVDLDLLFRFDANHNPELHLTVSDGHVAVHRPDWSVVLDADLASLDLYYSDDTHLRADWAALLNATLTVSGMEDLPITFAFAGAGNVVVDTDTRAATFELRADAGVSVPVGGDAGVRLDDLHLAGSFDDGGLDVDFDAGQVRIGPEAEPWVVVAGATGTITSDVSGHHWALTMDVGTVTAGDLLLTGQVSGSLQVGTTTTGGLSFTGEVTLGGVIRTLSISAAGMWTGSSLTIAGSIRTGGYDFFGQATWARLGGGRHQLASLARWETDTQSVGLDINLTHDGVDGLYGTMSAYGVSVWEGTTAAGTVVATFAGTYATTDVTIDVGPATGVRIAATLDWDVDTIAVADGTFAIEAATTIFGRTVGAAVTVGGSIEVGGGSMSVDLSADGHVGLINDGAVLYFDGMYLSFDIAGGTLTDGTFGGTLYLGPSNWIDINGTFDQPATRTWGLTIATSSGNATMGLINGVLVSTGDAFTGNLTADDVAFGPARLDNVDLSVTRSAVIINSLDAELVQTSSTPPLRLEVRDVRIAWSDSRLDLSGTLTFGLGGPGWLPVACAAQISASASLRHVGVSTFTSADENFAGCEFGEYGNELAGISVQLDGFSGRYTTDGSGSITSASVGFSGELRFGDLFDLESAHFSGTVGYDDATETLTLDLAGSYGTYTIDGTIDMVNGGQLGAYDFTLQSGSGALVVGPFMRLGSARVQTPIRLVGSGSQFAVTTPRLTLEGADNGNTVYVSAVDVTLTKVGGKLVLTGFTGGVQQVLGEFGAVVVTAPTVDSLTAEIGPGSLTFGIDADFTATINNPPAPPSTLDFSTSIDVVVDTNSADITVAADMQATVDWQPIGGVPAVNGSVRVGGTVNIDLDSRIVTLTGGSLQLSPTVSIELPGFMGVRPFLDGATAGSVNGTINLNNGELSFSLRAGILVHLQWQDFEALTKAVPTSFDLTLTNDTVQISNGEAEIGVGAVLLLGLPNPSGPEVTGIWGRIARGQDPLTAPWCGTKWTGGPTGPGCTTAGTVTGTVEADLDLDGQGDGWPADVNQRPAGAKVSLVSNPAISQYINPSDGTFTLAGVPAGTQTVQVTAPPTWSAVGAPTRQVTVAANSSVAATPPFVVQPYDRGGGKPYFVGAVGPALDLGEVPQNTNWPMSTRKTTEIPIQVVDPDGDSVELSFGPVYTPAYLQACGGGPVCLELNANGVLEVNPPPGWSGLVAFKLSASDGHWEDVSVLAYFRVKAIECGAVEAPPTLSYTIDEDTVFNDTFTLGDPCNSYFPAARVITPPEHGIASAGIQMIPGNPGPAIPTHDILFAYMPAVDWSGQDSFVIESCNRQYPTPDGPPFSCAQTTVYVTVTPIDDPPRLVWRLPDTANTGQIPYVKIEYQNMVSLPSFPETEWTYTFWAYDPEGLFSVEDGSITMVAPNSTSERNPEDLGISRSDFDGYGDWDVTITPPEGWDGTGDFAMQLCDPVQCGDKTAYLRKPVVEDPDWTASNIGKQTIPRGDAVAIAPWQITRSIPILPDMPWNSPNTADIQITSMPPSIGIEGVTASPNGLTVDTASNFCNEDQDYMPTVGLTFNGVPVQLRLEVSCYTDGSFVGSTYLAAGQTKTHAWAKSLENVYAREDPSAFTDEDVLVDNLGRYPTMLDIKRCGTLPGQTDTLTFGPDQKLIMAPNACLDEYGGFDHVSPMQLPPPTYCQLPIVANCDWLGDVYLVASDVNNDPEVGVEYMSVKVQPGSSLRLTGKQLARDYFGAIDPEDVFDLSVDLVNSLSGSGTIGAVQATGGIEFTAPWTPGVSAQQFRFTDRGGVQSKIVTLIIVTSPDTDND